MERINQYELYKMGQTLQKLRKEGELDPAEIFMDLILARGEMFQLLKGSPFPVTVSAVKSQELLDALDVVINKYFYRKDEGGKPSFSFPAKGENKIETYEWNNIVTTLGHFETVFGEEMRDSATYYVPRRGIFNTKALVDSADEAFPKDVADLILEKTRAESDLIESGGIHGFAES